MALSPCLCFASVIGISAVHEQCVTDHITCAGAAEPQHGRGNLLWLGNATDWFILQKLGQDLGITAGQRLRHWRIDRAWADRVDADLPGGVFEGGSLRQADHAVLGCVIGREPGTPMTPPIDEQLTIALPPFRSI